LYEQILRNLGVNIFGGHANNFLSVGAGATVFGGIVGIGDLNKPAKFQPNRTVNIEDIGSFVEKLGQKCGKRPPSLKIFIHIYEHSDNACLHRTRSATSAQKTVNKICSESEKFGGGGKNWFSRGEKFRGIPTLELDDF
jgi:hypothetical protein